MSPLTQNQGETVRFSSPTQGQVVTARMCPTSQDQEQDDASRVLHCIQAAAQAVTAHVVDHHHLPPPDEEDAHPNQIVCGALVPVVISEYGECEDNDPLTLVVNVKHVEPAVSKVFSPPWHPKEVFPSAAVLLPFPQTLPLQTPPPPSSKSVHVKQTPYPSPSPMDPPYPRNGPRRSSSCHHLYSAPHPPSSSLTEVPG